MMPPGTILPFEYRISNASDARVAQHSATRIEFVPQHQTVALRRNKSAQIL